MLYVFVVVSGDSCPTSRSSPKSSPSRFVVPVCLAVHTALSCCSGNYPRVDIATGMGALLMPAFPAYSRSLLPCRRLPQAAAVTEAVAEKVCTGGIDSDVCVRAREGDGLTMPAQAAGWSQPRDARDPVGAPLDTPGAKQGDRGRQPVCQ